jgi:hypothetical protein
VSCARFVLNETGRLNPKNGRIINAIGLSSMQGFAMPFVAGISKRATTDD